jgi:hypothetical protein
MPTAQANILIVRAKEWSGMIRHQSDPGAILQICSTKRNCLPHNEPIAMIVSATSEPDCVATR